MEKFFVVLALVLVACGSDESFTGASDDARVSDEGNHPGRPDGTVALIDSEVPEDSGMSDSSVDPMSDAGQDASMGDGSVDPIADAGQDSATDEGDAEVDSGTDADVVEPECPGSGPGVMCEGLTRFACVEGQWAAQETCEHVCIAGACTGVCDPGDKDCSGNFPRECNDNGQWVSAQACSFVCSAGECVGACVPGDRDCQGDVPRECNTAGQWVAETACAFVCGGEGVCGGSCEPGAKSCSGDVPRTCNASGQWVNGSACDFVCVASSGNCGGVCEPGDRDCSGDVPRSCNQQGQWVAETACQFICGGEGVCSGSCEPGAVSCTGDVPRTCNSAGAWTNGTACPFVCIAGSGCGGVCEPGDTKCSGSQVQTCGSNGQWSAASSCGAVAGATSYCSAGECTFDCNLDYDDCDGNPVNGCEVNLSSDANNCGSCGHSCCGGTCGDGTCGTANVATGVTAFDVSDESVYYIYNNQDIYTRSLNGGVATVFASRPSAQTALTDVATNGQEVAWGVRVTNTSGSEWGGVYSKSVSGGTTATEYECYNCTTYPVHIDYDANNLYWQVDNTNAANGYTSSQVHYNPLTNPNINPSLPYTVYATETGGGNAFAKVREFTSDGTHLYASLYEDAAHPDHIIHKALPNNLIGNNDVAFETFAGTNPSIYSPVTDGQYLYYIVYEYSGMPTYPNIGIWRKPLAGGSASKVVATSSITPRIATDGVNVYYVDSISSQLRLRKVPVAGGTPTTLANLANNLTRIRVANECVVWSVGTNVFGSAVNP